MGWKERPVRANKPNPSGATIFVALYAQSMCCCSIKCCAVVAAFIAIVLPNAFFYLAKDGGKTAGSIPFLTPKETWKVTYDDIPDQTGRKIIITGANVGLGLSSAKILAQKNAKVIMACRNLSRCDKSAAAVKNVAAPLAEVSTMLLDLSSLKSVKDFATKFTKENDKLHAVMLNAGIMHTKYGLSYDGIEQQFAVNHVGHQYLVSLLLPLLEHTSSEDGPTFVASVSSSAAHRTYAEGIRLTKEAINDESTYNPYYAYGQTKLSNIFMTQELTRQLDARGSKGVFVNSVHPGVVKTALARQYPAFVTKYVLPYTLGPLLWDPDVAALSQVYLCTDDHNRTLVSRGVKGKFFVPIARLSPGYPKHSDNLQMQKQLWHFTEELIDEAMSRREAD